MLLYLDSSSLDDGIPELPEWSKYVTTIPEDIYKNNTIHIYIYTHTHVCVYVCMYMYSLLFHTHLHVGSRFVDYKGFSLEPGDPPDLGGLLGIRLRVPRG